MESHQPSWVFQANSCFSANSDLQQSSTNQPHKLSDESLKMNQLRSRFRGCLLGVHVGDTLGSPFEGDHTVARSNLRNYLNNLLTPKAQVQVFPYTDDTCMTHSIAESIVQNKGFNGSDMARRFSEEYFKEPRRGYGSNVVDVFNALRFEDYQDPFGPAKMQFRGSGSFGNGAAMRIAPVALFAYNMDDDKVNELAANCSKITHSNAKGINGAILQCHAIKLALQWNGQMDPIEFVRQLLDKMVKVEASLEERDRIYSNAMKEMLKIFEGTHRLTDPTAYQIADYFGNSVSAMKSVPTAIYSALRSFKPIDSYETQNPFLRCLFFSIVLGGDTDTIASMACAIVGALQGDDVIPELMIQHTENAEKSTRLADQLFDIVRENPSSS